MMGISDVVNYGTVILWIVAAVIYVARLVRGEVVIPSLLSRILASSIILGVVIALGLIGSAAQVYLYYTKPAKVVEKIVEKPVDRIVEKVVQAECAKTSNPVMPSRRQEKQGAASPSAVVIPPNATIEATTNAPDSAAVGINTGTVTVNPPVNPNRPTLTYFCSGESKSFGPGANAVIEMNACFGDGCETVKKFNAMVQLNNAAYKEIKEQGKTIKYSELLDRCNEQISSTPEWLTPYLFCSVAAASLGQAAKAKEMLAYYDARTGPSYSTGACKEISDHLHKALP